MTNVMNIRYVCEFHVELRSRIHSCAALVVDIVAMTMDEVYHQSRNKTD